MTTIEELKNRLIDKILVSDDEQLLSAIEVIFKTTADNEILNLDSYQIEMLLMSEDDISNDLLISEKELDKSDSEWLN